MPRMSATDIVGLIVAVLGIVAVMVKLGRDRGAVDLAIETAARKAKHDAVGAVTSSISDIADTRVHVERYEADQRAVERRLEVIERALHLDGSTAGPPRG